MQIGQQEYPIEESVLFLVLMLVLGLNMFLFNRGHGSYTIKYEIMRKHYFFRVNQLATDFINLLYQLFFALPFIIITAITILRGIKDYMEFPAIFVNGLIVILILYPVYRQYYYFQYGLIWFLALASQLFSQFLTDPNLESTSGFLEISFIFYTLNSMVFCLALLFNEKVYWDLEDALKLVDEEQVKKVNSSWINNTKQRRLPEIFYGGIYGAMSKNESFSYFLGIYLFSVSILAVYAIVIYFVENTMLGVCGLVTNIIYDIFILVFSSLRGTERSIKDLFFMVYLGRLLSFVFGQDYWLFGYCILYFFVGIYVGNIIIEKNFPMRIDSKKKETKRVKKNVLKTPEFILLLLTVEIIVLILVEELSNVTTISKLKFHDDEIPIWQFAILIVLAAWVIILYLLCGRLLARHIMKIREMVEYYFGFSRISQYHAYMLLTYLLILAGGLYSLFYLNDKDIFLACIFLPLIYHFIFEIGTSWIKNDYCILADHEAYDKRQIQKLQIREIKLKKRLKKVEDQLGKRINRNLQQKTAGSALDQEEEKDGEFTNTAFQMTTKSFFVSSRKNKLPTIKSFELKNNKKLQNQEFDQKKIDKNLVPSSNTIQISHRSAEYDQICKQLQELKKQKQNQRPLLNWRMDTTLTYLQIWQNLTPYDKTILTFLILTVFTLIGYTVVSFLWAETIGGLGFSLSIISLLTTFFYYKINMSLRYNAAEIIITIVGFLIGIVFWSFFYNITFGGIIWSVAALLLYGFCLRNGIEKSIEYIFLRVMLAIKIVLLLCFICILLGLNYGNVVLVVSFGIVVTMMFGALNVYHLFTKGHIPKILRIITGIIILSIVGSLSIIGFVLDVISDFAVFAITSGIIILALLIIYFIISFTKSRKELIHPHVYSAFGLTIYRFESEIQQLKSSTNHIQIFNAAMILLVIFSSVTTLFYKEKYVAIYGLSVFLICQFTELILRSIETHYFFGQNKENVTPKIINESFKMVKDKYMASEIEGEDSPEFIKLFEKTKQEAEKTTIEDKKNELWLKVSELKEEVVKNLEEEERFLFFWIALMRFGIYTERKNKMNDFLIILEETKAQLSEAGIIFQALHSADPVQIKYKMAKKELMSLPPDDYLLVVQKLEQQMKLKKKKQKQNEKSHKEEIEAHKKKMEEFFNKEAEMKKTLDMKQISKDSTKSEIQLFKEMIQKLEDNLFVDEEFQINDSTLGKLNSVVKGSRRPKPGQKFITGTGMSPDDVKQGKIGDCYLISSFAVLGQKFLKMSLGYNLQNEEKPLWKNEKGAFMIKLHIFSRQVYIKIDDTLPVDEKNNKVFATSQDSLEYWPGILQKAYAKLYGGYQNIVSGKCHQVLAEFSGGFPFEVQLDEYRNNNNALWNRLLTSKKNGYLLAAGSPSNPKGDSVASKNGIVQGHAYAILDVLEIENTYKLIKLKNPHGSEGNQWTGEFSDDSNYMNQKRRKLLNHEKKNDGIFWMKLEHFINEFHSLYICCIFEKDWNKFGPIQGYWLSGVNSFGRPQKTDRAHQNYQIGITVTKQSTLFISLRQKNKTALEGQNYVYIRVQRNSGKRLRKNDAKSQNLCGSISKLSNSATLSQQILLTSDQYPYTFTIYFCAQRLSEDASQKSSPGKGQFNIQMFCNDLESKLIEEKDFDKVKTQ